VCGVCSGGGDVGCGSGPGVAPGPQLGALPALAMAPLRGAIARPPARAEGPAFFGVCGFESFVCLFIVGVGWEGAGGETRHRQ
jgi:hypothetical protein